MNLQEKDESIDVQAKEKNPSNEEKPNVSDRGSLSSSSKGKRIAIAVVIPIIITFLLYQIFIKEEKKESSIELNKNITDEQKERMSDIAKGINSDEDEILNNQELISGEEGLQEFPNLELPELPKVQTREKRSRTSDDFSNPFAFKRRGDENENFKQKERESESSTVNFKKPQNNTIASPKKSPKPNAPIAPAPSSSKEDESFKAKMMVKTGGKRGSGSSRGVSHNSENSDNKDDDSLFEAREPVNHNSVLPKTSARQTTNSYFGERGSMLLQGKIIEIVLETAINTDLEGQLRGIVASDVFAEAGMQILIPKGSRAIGSYSSSVKSGQSRVEVNWERIIRPDNIDINLKAEGTDQLGRSGISGEFDAHISTAIRNSVLVSIVTILSGVMLEQIFNNDVVTKTVGSGGDITTSSSVAYSETQDAFSDITDEIEDALDKTLPSKPTIRVNAGTIMKALITEDIVFLQKTPTTYVATPRRHKSGRK